MPKTNGTSEYSYSQSLARHFMNEAVLWLRDYWSLPRSTYAEIWWSIKTHYEGGVAGFMWDCISELDPDDFITEMEKDKEET